MGAPLDGYPTRLGISVGITALVGVCPAPVHADSFKGIVQPSAGSVETVSADSDGVETRSRSQRLMLHCRLNLEKELFPKLRFRSGGLYEGLLLQGRMAGDPLRNDSTTNRLFADLALRDPRFNGSASFSRREASNKLRLNPRLTAVQESYELLAGMRPVGLPHASLRLTRDTTHDNRREAYDTQRDGVLLMADYEPIPAVALNYSLRRAGINDRVQQTETTTNSHSARATYQDTLFDGRTKIYAEYNLTHRTTRIDSAGAGEVLEQAFPVVGLSRVADLFGDPTQIALDANPALVDGNTATGASINLGHTRGAAGDAAQRHIGAQFGDAVTPVNQVHVWVDRILPQDVASAFSWTVYQSDDNFLWTVVPLLGTVTFNPYRGHFVLPIPETRARYLKVVTTPLPVSINLDEDLADIFVTEIQFFVAVPAAAVRTETANTMSRVNASSKTRIVLGHDLFHDLTVQLDRRHQPQPETRYFVSNGVSYLRQLGSVFALSARVAREDFDEGNGHEGAAVATSALTSRPLKTLTSSLLYSGSLRQLRAGARYTNALSLSNRALLYRGVTVAVGGAIRHGRNETRQWLQGQQVNASVTLVPHPKLSLSPAYVYNRSLLHGGHRSRVETYTERIAVGFSFNPWPVIYVHGTFSRLRNSQVGTRNLGNFATTLSPFRDGALQLQLYYSENFDALTERFSRQIAPSLRWNIRPGTYLNATYTYLEVESEVGSDLSNSLAALLTVTL